MNMFLDSSVYLHHDEPHLEDDHHEKTVSLPAAAGNPRVILRTPSKSEPRIEKPHLIMSQDDQHPSLNRVLSSLFDASSMTKGLHPGAPGMQTSASSGALLADQAHLQAPPLRKTSSAVDWAVGLSDGITRKTSFQQHIADWSSHLLDSPRKQSFGNLFPHPSQPVQLGEAHLPIAAIRKTSSAVLPAPIQEEAPLSQGGLVMSTATADRQMVQAHAPSTPFAQHIASASSSSSGHSTPSTVNPLDPVVQPERKTGGMLGNMFKTGFFARPVVRTEEENYRYMMALDR